MAAQSKASAGSTPDTASGAAKGRGWLLAIAGCVVLIAVAAWYLWPSPKGSQDISSGSGPGTTEPAKSVTQPAITAPPVGGTTQVGGAADKPSSVAVASEKPPTSRPQEVRDVVAGTIPVRFQAGSSSVTAADNAVVEEILTYLSAHPASRATVSGYASSDGDLAMNESLAKKRADAFKAYLVGRGAKAERIVAVGRGIEDPIAPNDSEGGRAKNRRVKVNF